MDSAEQRRVVTLPVAPLTPDCVAPFGSFQAHGAASEPGHAAAELIALFRRHQGADIELELRAGETVVLGPASDPLRCRALPGEREFRAFRAAQDGVLKLAPGVWFHGGTPRRRGGALDERDYGEIFGIAFAPVEGPAMPGAPQQNPACQNLFGKDSFKDS